MTAGMPGEQHASAGKCCPRAEESQAGMEGRLFLPRNILGSLFPGAQIIDAQAGSDDNADRNKEDIGNHGTGGVNHAALGSRQNSPARGGSADDLYGCYGRRSIFFSVPVQAGTVI